MIVATSVITFIIIAVVAYMPPMFLRMYWLPVTADHIANTRPNPNVSSIALKPNVKPDIIIIT